MQFVLERVTSPGVRVGRILWATGHAPSVLDTPLCLTYTRSGAVPHLVHSVLQDVAPASRPPAAMLTLPTLYELPGSDVLAEYGHGIHQFLSLKDYFLYLSVQDPHHPPPPGYNGEKSTSLWTNGGRKKVTVEDYLQFVKVSQPNVFECLCDSVSSVDNKLKRVRKSVDRTLKFLDNILTTQQESESLKQCSLLGAVEGGDIVEERRRSALETAKRPVDGFVLEGFDLNHSHESLQSVIRSTTELLPETKPRFIHGLHLPGDVFTAVECGVDVFDGSYVYTSTEKGYALTYPNQKPPSEKADAAGITTSNMEHLPFQLDLNESRYAEDFSSILSDCDCYCCRHHSRAYLHHLLQTKEILASTLLMMHNLTHHMRFFANLREAIGTSDTEYTQYKTFCMSHLSVDTSVAR